MKVRIRGIYATALTALLGADYRVVQASDSIRERFDEAFPVEPAAVSVRTTADREGVGLAGTVDGVTALRESIADVGLDTFTWRDPAPRGAVFRGVVAETLGSGAILTLGPGGGAGEGERGREGRDLEGYLPDDRVAEPVEAGETLRVQVASPEPPWSDRRPTLATDLRIPGGLLELRRTGGDPDRSISTPGETPRVVDLLPVNPPDGWTAVPRTEDADLDALAAALERATDRAEAVMAGIAAAAGADPGRLVAPIAGAWVWFGRESRFALDAQRAEVTTTMPGHHRIKAGGNGMSAAVDLVEAVCDSGGEFPFDAVTRGFGPTEGETVAIHHGKPDGRTIVLGRGEVRERSADGRVRIERSIGAGGTYDGLGVDRREGDVATTTVVEGRWWYPTVYRGADGNRRGTYVNVCTPVEVFPDRIRYVDLHVDVVKDPDGTVRRIDDDELDAAVEAGHVSGELAARARSVAASIEAGL